MIGVRYEAWHAQQFAPHRTAPPNRSAYVGHIRQWWYIQGPYTQRLQLSLDQSTTIQLPTIQQPVPWKPIYRSVVHQCQRQRHRLCAGDQDDAAARPRQPATPEGSDSNAPTADGSRRPRLAQRPTSTASAHQEQQLTKSPWTRKSSSLAPWSLSSPSDNSQQRSEAPQAQPSNQRQPPATPRPNLHRQGANEPMVVRTGVQQTALRTGGTQAPSGA